MDERPKRLLRRSTVLSYPSVRQDADCPRRHAYRIEPKEHEGTIRESACHPVSAPTPLSVLSDLPHRLRGTAVSRRCIAATCVVLCLMVAPALGCETSVLAE